MITGAASGIGAAVAKRFAEEKAIVILSDYNETLGKQITEQIRLNHGIAHFIKLDVSDENHWKNVISFIENEFQQLNILINNAGVAFQKSILETTSTEWRRLMAINLDGLFLGTKYCIPLLQKCPANSIVNMSSISGMIGSPDGAAYCASKGAIRAFTKAVALECAKLHHPIRVNSIHPGPVYTSILDEDATWKKWVTEKGNSEKVWDAIAEITPLNRIAEPREIANAILFLASDQASYMTGSELIVDGGITAQ